ncbi:MAG: HAD-IA family hydrolase [Candidatus Nanopelagicales bacterium]|jgi:sugar-phosphatase
MGAAAQDGRGSGQRIDAVLLDMDGTLVESHAAVERAWAAWCAEYAVDPEDAWPVVHGAPADRSVRILRPDLDDAGVAQAAARQLALQYDDLSDVAAAPGAHDLLAELDRLGLPWAVVTSADRPLSAARLGAAGIAPPLLVTRDDVAEGKPAPDPYLLASRLLGVAPTACLVVEDAGAGVASGRAAGMLVAGLAGVPADIAVRTLADVVGLLLGRSQA